MIYQKNDECCHLTIKSYNGCRGPGRFYLLLIAFLKNDILIIYKYELVSSRMRIQFFCLILVGLVDFSRLLLWPKRPAQQGKIGFVYAVTLYLTTFTMFAPSLVIFFILFNFVFVFTYYLKKLLPSFAGF